MARSIFFYTDSRLVGGAEHALLNLICALDREAWRAALLVDDVPDTSGLVGEAQRLKIPVRRVPPMPLGLSGARHVPRMARMLRAERPDVFHAHLTWPLGAKYPLLSATMARVPAVVATVHLIPAFTIDRSNLLQLRALSLGIDRYIAVSRSIADELAERFRWPRRKIEVIHNAVASDRFGGPASPGLRSWLGGEPPRPVVFTCGRLHEQKGHAVLLEAAAQIPDAVFALAGDGPERPALEARASNLGIADRIRFLGFRDDIPALLAASDVFALPSLYEGTSLAVLEAMAAGRAIVSTDIGGTNELIEDGKTGLLVPSGDVAALVEALRRVLADSALRDELGHRARERARRDFTPQRVAAGVVGIYEELLAGACRG